MHNTYTFRIIFPTKGEGGHIGFSADPVGFGDGVCVGVDRFVPTISLEEIDGVPPNLSGYILEQA